MAKRKSSLGFGAVMALAFEKLRSRREYIEIFTDGNHHGKTGT